MEEPKTPVEKRLLEWDSDQNYTPDDIHRHFESLAERLNEWPAVAREGLRIWNMMFNDSVEEDSAVDAVLAGIAAAADECALRQVASRIGVSVYAVRLAIETVHANDPQRFFDECLKADNQKPSLQR